MTPLTTCPDGLMCEKPPMANVNIRNLPDEVHLAIRIQAAHHGRSTEAEIRAILERASGPEARLKLGSYLAADALIAAIALAVTSRMIAVTVWVVIFPRSGLTWRVFPDLPTPPADLAGCLPGRERHGQR